MRADEADLKIGYLKCIPVAGFDDRDLRRCSYLPIGGAPLYFSARIERYRHRVRHHSAMLWEVLSRVMGLTAAGLTGDYADRGAGGVPAGMVGLLAGGHNNSVRLQPLAFPATAHNAAAEVTEIFLLPRAPAAFGKGKSAARPAAIGLGSN